MKKYLILILSVLLVLGSVSFVIADDGGMDSMRASKPGAKVYLGGTGRVRGVLLSNPDADSDTDDTDRWVEQRFRLIFNADVSNGVGLRSRIGYGTTEWDGEGGTTRCSGGACVYVDYAYFRIPISTATLEAGRQVRNFGKKFIIWDERIDSIDVTATLESVTVNVFTDKLVETRAADDKKDKNNYGGSIVANINDIEAGAILVYTKDSRTGADPDSGQLISLYADANIEAININGEVSFATGDLNKTPDSDGNPNEKTPFGFFINANTSMGDARVGLTGAYAKNQFRANNHFKPTLFIGEDNVLAGSLADTSGSQNFGNSAAEESAWMIAADGSMDAMENVNVKAIIAYGMDKEAGFVDGDVTDAKFFEIDGIVTYQQGKNARASLAAGWVKPSDLNDNDDAIAGIELKQEIWF